MKKFFSPNVDNKGRLFRGLIALALLVSAGLSLAVSVWLGVALLASGAFVAFEALRGWCVLRACGVSTKL